MKKLSHLLVAVFVAVGLFSCNVLDITKKRYSNGYYISTSGGRKVDTQDHIVKEKTSNVAVAVVANETKKEQAAETIASENCDKVAVIEKTQDASTSKNAHKKQQRILANSKAVFALKSSKLAVSKLQMQEQRLLINNSTNKGSNADVNIVLMVILALLLAPLAVFLKRGISPIFWLTLLLWLIGISVFFMPIIGLSFLASVVIALLVVFDAI